MPQLVYIVSDEDGGDITGKGRPKGSTAWQYYIVVWSHNHSNKIGGMEQDQRKNCIMYHPTAVAVQINDYSASIVKSASLGQLKG